MGKNIFIFKLLEYKRDQKVNMYSKSVYSRTMIYEYNIRFLLVSLDILNKHMKDRRHTD